MKKSIIILIIAFIGISSGFAQDWQTDFSKAKELATKEKKPIILVFQGSDWCAPCIKLSREIWSTETFINYAKDNYIMFQADFPRKKKNALPEKQAAANAKLAEIYDKNGVFPLVVVLDNRGNLLGETGYKKTTPKAYIQELDSFIK
ncbi:thioredoxin family protein [Cyclobacterium amurskyense]|uniref:Thiol-disulfide isomerase n=1 Tax=Cyclobacterium amurskyense TaxID=320787 RepID=A0A0H4PBE7_9BACT|nr:thioredoxin family protein [Cyclobacterium amurskyense]AKP51776.1 thiol-disulfide isomerase [Cyclobacterium amurskyense]|tara:strand:- start:3569 stop:4009 length:441 start_codon:yes stop_codon:yes gene_type:complete